MSSNAGSAPGTGLVRGASIERISCASRGLGGARRLAVAALAILTTLLLALLLPTAPAFAAKEYIKVSSFGEPCSNPEACGVGQFQAPIAVAANDSVELSEAAGDVYVLDAEHGNGIQRFSSSGTFLSKTTGSEVPGGRLSFSIPQDIAVDNARTGLEPSVGDVYAAGQNNKGEWVVAKFTATGHYLCELTGLERRCLKEPSEETLAEEDSPGFSKIFGVTVDPQGNVWTVDATEEERNGRVSEFSGAGAFLTSFSTNRAMEPGIAVDSAGNIYVQFACQCLGKYSSSFEQLGAGETELTRGILTGFAVDPSTNDLFVGQLSSHSILVFGPFGEPYNDPVQRFPREGIAGTKGLALGANGTVYVADESTHAIDVYEEEILPSVTTGQAREIDPTTEILNGSVNPSGEAITECRFEYGTEVSYGQSVPCAQTVGEVGAGNGPVPVSVELNELQPLTEYHFRLVGSNAHGTNVGADETFFTSTSPTIENESVSAIASAGAAVGANIDAAGLLTDYHVEYGATEAYGSSTLSLTVGAAKSAVGVLVHLSGLTPGSTYHARVVAHNALGTADGEDLAFTTPTSLGPTTSTLPDGRSYELVTVPGSSAGNVYVPETIGIEPEASHQVFSGQPIRASASGERVVFVAEPPPEAGGSGSSGDGGGNNFLGQRSTAGWTATSIMPPVANHDVYRGFSNDLSSAFLLAGEVGQAPLTPDAPGDCSVEYARTTSDGRYHALFTSLRTPGDCGQPHFAGVSADDSSAIFESEVALTPEATPGSELGSHEEDNLYDSVGGRLFLVNVLPDGHADVNAAFGGVSVLGEETNAEFQVRFTPGYHHYGQAVSTDGSHIVWTDLNTGDLYVRLDPATPAARTVQVDASVGGGGRYQGASGDGSKIFYTKSGNLYEYDVNGETTTDLAPGGAVLGVNAIGEDASHVYFVAEGVLASNENAHGETPTAGAPNLYLAAGGETRFIASLSTADGDDWRSSFALRTAEGSPDGRNLVFTSSRSITGYDNRGTPEVFVYDALTGDLSCASCNPSGEPPTEGAPFLPRPEISARGIYQLRWISADGSRVFFDTPEPLVAQDTNGVQDVYEWEREGAGTCRQPGGCVYLISSNLSSEMAWFVDASANGNDVFFVSRAQLVPQDGGQEVQLYDARVGGGFPQASTECTGSGCQGAPPAPPSFATPPSATFNGIGNFVSPPPGKPGSAAQTNAQRLAKALKACRSKRSKHKRAVCQAQARKRYGPPHKAAKSRKRSKKGRKS